MRRKKYLGKRILSFMLAFVLIFSQSGMLAFAEGEEDQVEELDIADTDNNQLISIEYDEDSDEEEIEGADYGVWTWPVQGQTPLSNLTQNYEQHGRKAIDIGGAEGTPILAAKGGVVTHVVNDCTHRRVAAGVCVHQTYYTDGGNTVYIDHGNGVHSVYSHMILGSVTVVPGQTVTAGQVIGLLGDSGHATGFHLHFAVRVGGSKWDSQTPINPESLDYSGGGNGGSNTPPAYSVTNTGVTNIAKNSATINSTVSPMAYVTELGFYLGTAQNSMTKYTDSSFSGGNVITMWYDLGTGKWTSALAAGTRYYYKFYMVSGGKTYESPVDSFVTQPNPVIVPATDIKDGGRYLIESVLSGKVIEVSNGVDTDRKQLNVWEYTNDPWQSWIAVKSGDKYILKNAYTGKAMDVYRASTDEGAAVTQYTLDGSASQYWTLDKRDDGSYGIVNNNSGLAVDLIGFSQENGATLGQYIYYANSNQRWYFNEVNSNDDVIYDSGVENITSTGAKLNATLPVVRSCTDIGFYLGTSPDKMEQHNEKSSGRTKIIWYDLGTGKWTSALSKGTTYYYQLYCVIDGITYKTPLNNFTTLGDKTAPNIKQAYVTNITQDGFTVVCEASDNVGIERVICPTWTDYNGQDDLKGDYYNNTKATLISGNTYNYNVKISDHNNERGKYIIDVYAYDAEANYTKVQLSVFVPTYISGITLSKTSLSLKAGETTALTASIVPSDATEKDLVWKSSDESIATVDYSGTVTAIAAGKAIITAYAQDPSGKSASCEVTVTGSSTPTPADTASVNVASVSATPGLKVEVPVSISKNPGIAGAAFTVKYDKTALTLDELKAGTVFSSGTFTSKIDSGLVQWYYAGESGIKTNGVMFTAVFTVNPSAANGNYSVTVGLLNDENANFTDHNGAEVPVTFAAGKVIVSDSVKGDLTGDGEVAMGDVVKVARAVAEYVTLTAEEEALADVTGDGIVAMGDVVKIARYVAGYIDTLDVVDTVTVSVMYQQNTIMSDIPGKEGQIEFAGEAEIVVSGNKAKAGESVEIPVMLKTNPGIASAAFTVSYNAASLELTSIKKGDVFSGGTFNGDTEKNLIQWYDVSGNKDTTATGTIFTLGFKVKETAEAGKYDVKLGYLNDEESNVTNINSENVKVNFTAGEVEVETENNEQPDSKTAVIEVGKGKAVTGKSIEIPVKITTNPGIASAAFTVYYDATSLSLNSITKGAVFSTGTFNADTEKNLIQWYDVSGNKDTTATGVMFTLKFDVKENTASGNYVIKLGYLNDNVSNVTNINSENVAVTFTDGEIEVRSASDLDIGKAKEDPMCVAPDVTEDTTDLYLIKGQKFTMPEAGWTSSNKKFVSVSKKGVVKAKKVTTTPITLTKDSRIINVYVSQPVIDKKLIIKSTDATNEYKIKLDFDSENLDVYWYSTAPDIAVVDDEGMVEGVSAGSATLIAYINGKAFKCKVSVKEPEPYEERTVHITAGLSKTLKVKGLKNPVWESDDTSIVTVNKNKITGVAKGMACLTTTVGEKKYYVYVRVDDLTLDDNDFTSTGKNKYSITMNAGDTESVYFSDIYQDVVFTTTKSEIAYISNDTGTLIARKPGKAKLTAKVNGKPITINVTVK